ncbi:kinase-like domain-containing protein [Lipomyces tetrasporus]
MSGTYLRQLVSAFISLRSCSTVMTTRPCSGGFHPVSIGDRFSRGRYRVLHKLGFGGFSTVWLARDQHSLRLVSLKVVTAEASSTCNELRILQHLNESAINHPACDHILSLLDQFTIEGPNGFHACLVSPFAGPDLAQISYTHRLRGALAGKFARQVTQAIGYLHDRGVAHGDLNTSNVLIQLAHVDSWSDEDVYEQLGFPVTDKVLLWSGELNNRVSAPEYLVEPANLSNIEYKWITEKVSEVVRLIEQQLATDLGYTFVGKGTTDQLWNEVRREADVYRALQMAQGSAVPVFLGTVDLEKTFLLHGGALDLWEEIRRSTKEIHKLEVQHGDLHWPIFCGIPNSAAFRLLTSTNQSLSGP